MLRCPKPKGRMLVRGGPCVGDEERTGQGQVRACYVRAFACGAYLHINNNINNDGDNDNIRPEQRQTRQRADRQTDRLRTWGAASPLHRSERGYEACINCHQSLGQARATCFTVLYGVGLKK
ncbi:hypothetical protein WAI453_001766 [Rhynchosporium graminicola]